LTTKAFNVLDVTSVNKEAHASWGVPICY